MFVHGVKKDRPLVLTLRQDEPGRAIKAAVHKQCPSLPSYFILLFRGRKVSSTVIWVRACEQLPGGVRPMLGIPESGKFLFVESGIREKICLFNSESWILESGIQLNESGIPQKI